MIAKLSTAHSDYIKANRNRPDVDLTTERNALKILTSRALLRGHMIAENAARGIFPSYAKCEHALPVDYGFIKARR